MASAIHAETNSTVLNALSADSGNSDITASAIKADNVLIQPPSVISLREITVSGSVIDEWNSCNATLGDTCKNPSNLCCVAPGDKLNGKTTCRPSNDCYVPPPNPGTVIGDWNECHANLGDTCSANFVCCVAPSDKLNGKTTCRPPNDCDVPPKTVIGDWNECHANLGETCNANFVCCVAPGDKLTGKTTCRPTN
ncbi:hypothetical protein HDU99_005080, partial [Rhizoclosmatium hyalinum]